MNIKKGKESLYRGVDERVIRLGGEYSDATELALQRYGDHILPIFEDWFKVKSIIKKHSNNYQFPIWF